MDQKLSLYYLRHHDGSASAEHERWLGDLNEARKATDRLISKFKLDPDKYQYAYVYLSEYRCKAHIDKAMLIKALNERLPTSEPAIDIGSWTGAGLKIEPEVKPNG